MRLILLFACVFSYLIRSEEPQSMVVTAQPFRARWNRSVEPFQTQDSTLILGYVRVNLTALAFQVGQRSAALQHLESVSRCFRIASGYLSAQNTARGNLRNILTYKDKMVSRDGFEPSTY